MSYSLPEPVICDCCKSARIVFENIKIKNHTSWPYRWRCLEDDCQALVFCTEGTRRPLGRMGTSTTRNLRRILHDLFDPIWRKQYMSRDDAYRWMSRLLNIKESESHISWLTDDNLRKAIVHLKQPNILIEIRKEGRKNDRSVSNNKRNILRRTNKKSTRRYFKENYNSD